MSAIEFSPWAPWNARNSFDHSTLGGVYLLAKFDDVLPAVANPLAKEVIMIGRTDNFRRRWPQFEACAFEGKIGHLPGITFHTRLMNSTPGSAPSWLYVAIYRLWGDHLDQAETIKLNLISDYHGRNGENPICNTKGG